MCKKAYIENIKDLAGMHSGLDIPNTGIKHAKNELRIMVKNAKKNINIFEPKLDERIYDNDILCSIIAFLRYYRKGKLTVIVDNQTVDEVKKTLFYKMLKDFKVLQRSKFYVAKEKIKSEYFQTVDGRAYRKELFLV